MNNISESDYLSPSHNLTKLYENNGYGMAVNDLWDIMKSLKVEPIIASQIFGRMVINHAAKSLPTDKNLYDKL